MNNVDRLKCKAILQETINNCQEYKVSNLQFAQFSQFESCAFVGQINLAYNLGLITSEEYDTYKEILNSILIENYMLEKEK